MGLNPYHCITHVCVVLSNMFRMVLETDANVIAGKVAMQSAEASGSLSEQVRLDMTISTNYTTFEQSNSLYSDYSFDRFVLFEL